MDVQKTAQKGNSVISPRSSSHGFSQSGKQACHEENRGHEAIGEGPPRKTDGCVPCCIGEAAEKQGQCKPGPKPVELAKTGQDEAKPGQTRHDGNIEGQG